MEPGRPLCVRSGSRLVPADLFGPRSPLATATRRNAAELCGLSIHPLQPLLPFHRSPKSDPVRTGPLRHERFGGGATSSTRTKGWPRRRTPSQHPSSKSRSQSRRWYGTGKTLSLALTVQILYCWYVQIHLGHKVIEGALPSVFPDVLETLGNALSVTPLFAFLRRTVDAGHQQGTPGIDGRAGQRIQPQTLFRRGRQSYEGLPGDPMKKERNERMNEWDSFIHYYSIRIRSRERRAQPIHHEGGTTRRQESKEKKTCSNR